MKIERTRIHFFIETLSLPSPSSVLKVPAGNSRRRCPLIMFGGLRSSRPKVMWPDVISAEIRVMSPEIYRKAARNQHPITHLRYCFVASRLKE